MDKVKVIPTGCVKLDSLLGGGIPTGRLTLVYGEAGTGKTTLMLQVSISASRMGFQVLYIDSDKRFPAERLREMASRDFDKIARLILVSRPERFLDQSFLFERLNWYTSESTILTVVDSITGLYREGVAEGEPFTLNWELNRQLAYLKELALSKNIAVAITSQVRRLPETEEPEPVADRVLTYWADIIVKLSKTGKPRTRICEIRKGPRRGRFQVEISKIGMIV